MFSKYFYSISTSHVILDYCRPEQANAFFPLIPDLRAYNKQLTCHSHSNPGHISTYMYMTDKTSSFSSFPDPTLLPSFSVN